MTKHIYIDKARAQFGSRGRNRWFTARLLVVSDSKLVEPGITIEARSARPGRTAPVILQIPIPEAEAMACEILKMALTRADTVHRMEAIRALKMILAKLESEDTGEFREPIRDREDPSVHQTTGLDRTGPGN